MAFRGPYSPSIGFLAAKKPLVLKTPAVATNPLQSFWHSPMKSKLIVAAHVFPIVGLYVLVASGVLRALWTAVVNAVSPLTKRTTSGVSALAVSFKKAQQQQPALLATAAAEPAVATPTDVSAAKAKVAMMVKEEEVRSLVMKQQAREAKVAAAMESEAAALIADAEASKQPSEAIATYALLSNSGSGDLQTAVDNGRDKMIYFLAACGLLVPLLQVVQQ